MELRRDTFQAIADPTRRDIIHLLSEKPMNLNTLSAHFDISRPAISRHIRILTECGMVMITDQGRERYCKANLKKLKEVDKWLSTYRRFWNKKLDSLGEYLENHPDEDENTVY